jgi:hypothetical protein
MASIILTAVGTTIGSTVGAPGVGAQLGRIAGTAIDARRSGNARRHYEGARLEDLAVQTSTYGRMIPQVFGSVRIAGNVIWSRPIKEVATTTTIRSGGGKGGRSSGSSSQRTTTETTYQYYVTLAIAIAEGEITRLDRVWADAKLLDLSTGNYRIYLGTETQLPDPAMEAVYGVGKTPAYRGMAYVMIEDFPLAAFGNRIPNFSFEVTRKALQNDVGDAPVEAMVKSLMLIPGSGEFVYDTTIGYKLGGQYVNGVWAQQGTQSPMNAHTPTGQTNVTVALDQMKETFPNLEWVGLVVNWFATSLDTANCEIFPCVEYSDAMTTTPNLWNVAGYTRATARRVGYDGNAPRYGGTPDDASFVRLVTALRARGYKIFFYPMLLVDLPGKPWRGFITGAASTIPNFFTRVNGYNRFIQHYTTLMAGKIDAFAIGTELRDVTAITSGNGVFPAVSQLMTLAASVKAALGSLVKVTYAADWSEYHHTTGGWYNLDPLWASSAIDMVGIDAYFPLTDAPQSGYDRATIEQGWTSGEGYDWYYSDAARTVKASLAPAYAWKNIAWWWNNTHVNPNGVATPWVPGSKPIWFTEYGFPSVDGCTNEPNVFFDTSSSASAYPRFSRGRVDFMAQRQAIAATESVWANSPMVTHKFLWTWDARPYPYWPDLLSVWSDGRNWVTGHWVQGKLGGSQVAAVVESIFTKLGLADAAINSTALQASLDGFVIERRSTARAILEQLTRAYQFVFKESGGVIHLLPRAQQVSLTIDRTALVPEKEDASPLKIIREEAAALPQRVEVQYLQRLQRYATSVQAASRAGVAGTEEVETITLSLVLSDAHARAVADYHLATRWRSRAQFEFTLPIRYAALEVGDIITLTDGAFSYRLRLTRVQLGRPGMLRIRAMEDEAVSYEVNPDRRGSDDGLNFRPVPATRLETIELPAFPQDDVDDITVRFAGTSLGQGWEGASILRANGLAGEPEILAALDQQARMGVTLTALPISQTQRFDPATVLEVLMLGDASLSSAAQADVLNGANVALVGQEVIQFTTATALGEGKFQLKGLLRGRVGTEYALSAHAAGERFIMLDERLRTLVIPSSYRGLNWALKPVTYGQSDSAVTADNYVIAARSLMPLAPVHLQAQRDAGGNVTLRWIRRARHGGDWRSEVDIPLMEAAELYDVEIIKAGAVVRSWRVNVPEQLYTAAQQIADLGGVAASIRFRVYQISALVGRGQVAEALV